MTTDSDIGLSIHIYVFIDYFIRCIHHDDRLLASLTYLKVSDNELAVTSLG